MLRWEYHCFGQRIFDYRVSGRWGDVHKIVRTPFFVSKLLSVSMRVLMALHFHTISTSNFVWDLRKFRLYPSHSIGHKL